MKKFLLLLLFFLNIVSLYGREKVIFIPGWYTEWINYSRHRKVLEELFPGAELEVFKWDSNRMWENAKFSAEAAVNELCVHLENSTDRSEITLIGHSLGGRIVMECAVALVKKNCRIKQAILLGTAGNIDAEKLDALQKFSIREVINICCFNDNMLKLYISKEKSLPLGFSGISHPAANFRQFRMEIPDGDVKIGKVTVMPGEAMKPLRETIAHLALYYLKTLKMALNGELTPYCLNYPELERIAAQDSVKPDKLPGFKEVSSFDNWILEKRKWKGSCRIIAPSGRKFYYSDAKIAQDNFSKITGILKAARSHAVK